MKILFINHDGTGFADHLDISHGTRVCELFDARMHGARPDDHLIRVNRQTAARDQVLCEGDRVSFTPRKIEAARHQAA